MQPLKITIAGDYLDSQIYSGLLYLWDMNGSIKTIDFNRLILSLIDNKKDLFAFYCTFLDGRYLYKTGINNLLADQEFKDLLLEKIKRITTKELLIDEKDIKKYQIGEQDFAGNMIHIDSEIYNNKIYLSNDDGLFSFSIRSNTKFPVSTQAMKIWDMSVLSINANYYSQFALSAGSEGLFELNKSKLKYLNLKKVDSSSPIFEITSDHSNIANYNSLSLFNTSFIGSSGLYLFGWADKDEISKDIGSGKKYRKSIASVDIFGENGRSIAWGSDDKMYSLSGNSITVMKYNSNFESDGENEYDRPFNKITDYELKESPGRPIYGNNALFGIIIECEDNLLVLTSDNEINSIKGPITRWRTFPRSRNYENHLHVIKDSSLEIFSFYHDFLKNQQEKIFGIDSNLFFESGIIEDSFNSVSKEFKQEL